MSLVEIDGCVYDAEQLGRSRGYESLDPIGREAFVNHLHLSGDGREAAAEHVIRAWAAEMRARWADRRFRIYRQSEACEVTIRFHMVRLGVPDWCEGGIEVIVVGNSDAESGVAADPAT
ncbi:MAG TPA: hypothetical protein VGJ05_07540 [Fimbriiglobus sp.]